MLVYVPPVQVNLQYESLWGQQEFDPDRKQTDLKSRNDHWLLDCLICKNVHTESWSHFILLHFFILVISQIYLHVVSPSSAFWGFALWLRSSLVTYVIPPLGGAQAYSVFCCSGEKVFLWQLMSHQQLVFWLAAGGFLLSVSIHRRSESMWSTNTHTHPCLCDVVGTHDQSMLVGAALSWWFYSTEKKSGSISERT